MFAFLCRGPRGDDGDAGAQGEQGEQGIQGIQGEQGASIYTDRGDVAAVDFDEGDLTEDDAYHDLDLSGIVGANAVLVIMRVRIQATVAEKRIILKTKGASNAPNTAFTYALIADETNDTTVTVMTDAAGKLEYKASVATWTSIQLTVKGWFG